MAISLTRLSRPVRISHGGRGLSLISFSAVISGVSAPPSSGFEKYYQSVDNITINQVSGFSGMVTWHQSTKKDNGIFVPFGPASQASGFVTKAGGVIAFRFTAFGIV